MKIQSSASLNNSERDGLSEVLGYITKVYGDDIDFEKYDAVRKALSGDELKRLEDLLIYTIDDREYCKTVNKRILKDDLPLLNKVYEVLDDNDLFKNNRGDYDWDAMEAFEKLCLTSSKNSSKVKTIKSDTDWEAVKHGFDDKKYLIYKTGINGEWEEFPFYGTDDFSVADEYKGKGYRVEKNENINSSRRNAKEKIMNRRNMKKMVKSNVELRRFAKKVGKGWFMGDYDSNTGVITVTKIAPTVLGVNIGDEFTYDDIESIGYEDITEGINIKSSRKPIKSSVDSSTVADILKARKEVKEVEDRGDEVIAYLHKGYRDVDADRLADEVLGTIETEYDDFTWDYSSAWMDYNDDEYDDTYVVIIEKKGIESACHGKKKNNKKGKSVKSNRKQIKSGRFIKSGAGAGYDITIEGIELDDHNYRIISDEITDEKYNEHTTMVEVPVKPCVVEKWSAEDYYYGVSSEGLYVDGELVQDYFDDDKRINGGKAVLRIIWYLGDYESAEEACNDVIPRDININAGFGGGWSHVYLPNDEIHFEDKYHGYPIDAGEPYDYETMSVDLICPNISENINWYFKHDHELEEIFFGEGEENDDELFNSIERNQRNLNKIFR